jgi:PAS domain-containing protein
MRTSVIRREISDRKKAEKLLLKSEMRLRQFYESVTMGVLLRYCRTENHRDRHTLRKSSSAIWFSSTYPYRSSYHRWGTQWRCSICSWCNWPQKCRNNVNIEIRRTYPFKWRIRAICLRFFSWFRRTIKDDSKLFAAFTKEISG